MRTAKLFLGDRDSLMLSESALDEEAGDIRYFNQKLWFGYAPVAYADFSLLERRGIRAELDDLAVRAVMEMPGRVI